MCDDRSDVTGVKEDRTLFAVAASLRYRPSVVRHEVRFVSFTMHAIDTMYVLVPRKHARRGVMTGCPAVNSSDVSEKRSVSFEIWKAKSRCPRARFI